MDAIFGEPAFEGFTLGASLIIAIGAQNAYLLRQGLLRQGVFTVASICFLCDAVLILIGSAGAGTLISSSSLLLFLATTGGAAFLGWYGLRALRAALRPDALHVERQPTVGGSVGLTALALSLLNPHVYLDTVVLLGAMAGRYAGEARTAFATGAIVASASWFYGVGAGARQLAPFLQSPRVWRVIDAFVALVMWRLALSLAHDALDRWHQWAA